MAYFHKQHKTCKREQKIDEGEKAENPKVLRIKKKTIQDEHLPNSQFGTAPY